MTRYRRCKDTNALLVNLEGARRVISGNKPGRIAWRIKDQAPIHGGRLLASYATLPSLDDPRVLLPLDTTPANLRANLNRQARAAASPVMQFAGHLLSIAAGLGIAVPVMRHRLNIEAVDPALAETPLQGFLTELLGRRNISLSLRLAPGRPNSKPVVQVTDLAGSVIAFAKFGWEPLTQRLIRHEARMLSALSGPTAKTTVTVPRVIHAGSWEGLETLILVPLLTSGRMPRSVADIPVSAIRSLGHIGRMRQCLLGESHYWRRTKTRIGTWSASLPADSANAVHTTAQRIEDRWGDTPILFGLRHGDWIPPNMVVRADGGLNLWDWERGSFGAPYGIDTMQFLLFQALSRGGSDKVVISRLRHYAATALERQGVPGIQADLLGALSLIDTILWFGEARQAGRLTEADTRHARVLNSILDGGSRI